MLALETEKTASIGFRVSIDSGTSTLFVVGRLDVHTTGGVWQKALRVIEESHPDRFVVDASGVTYSDGECTRYSHAPLLRRTGGPRVARSRAQPPHPRGIHGAVDGHTLPCSGSSASRAVARYV